MNASDAVLTALCEANPRARQADLQIYANALLQYHEAQQEIERQGPVVAHPQTGAPIDNPYLSVRDKAAAMLLKLKNVKSDAAVAALAGLLGGGE